MKSPRGTSYADRRVPFGHGGAGSGEGRARYATGAQGQGPDGTPRPQPCSLQTQRYGPNLGYRAG